MRRRRGPTMLQRGRVPRSGPALRAPQTRASVLVRGAGIAAVSGRIFPGPPLHEHAIHANASPRVESSRSRSSSAFFCSAGRASPRTNRWSARSKPSMHSGARSRTTISQSRRPPDPDLVATEQGRAAFRSAKKYADPGQPRRGDGSSRSGSTPRSSIAPRRVTTLQQSQDHSAGARARLLVVADAYPNLTATPWFR